MKWSRRVAAVLAATMMMLLVPALAPTAQAAAVGGPVLVAGIDAEDGGPGGHGPIAVYETMVNNLLVNVQNGGSGVLVIGGGKNPGDSVTTFWNQIATDTGLTVTFVNGEANIATQSFAGFAMVAVSSSVGDTGGGLTDAESEALKLRSFDVAQHVNAGGALLVFSQGGQTTPYGFLGDLGTFVSAPISAGSDSDIDPTAAGTAAGVTDELDVCCWHDQFTTFPSFLVVLATYFGSTEVAAIGGDSVQIPTGIVLDPPTQQRTLGDACVVTATITENTVPVADRDVRFSVSSGPSAGLASTVPSNASGQAVFAFTASAAGTDTIVAEFTDSQGRIRTADAVTCLTVAPVETTTTTTTTTPAPINLGSTAATPVRARPAFTG